MRQFFIYGFKTRDEFDLKSPRAYDDERRRVESWLGEYMRFKRTPDGKNVFISIDSRCQEHNPLFKAWKAKSFTDGDITLHFLLFDILSTPEVKLTLAEIMSGMDERLSAFDGGRSFDESTVRKKLKEYEAEGLTVSEKRGRNAVYSRAPDIPPAEKNMLDFFSEVSPCGMIGSFLYDDGHAAGGKDGIFSFKHHVITFAMDAEIVCDLFLAMREKRAVTMLTVTRDGKRVVEKDIVPLKILRGVQTGRQYLMAYVPKQKGIITYRIDNIVSVERGEVSLEFDALRERLKLMKKHLWGVSNKKRTGQGLDRVEFTVRYETWEPFIHRRLEREKRCGTVERIDENHSRFTAEVYDASELTPWIRTFISRITELSISDKLQETRFREDLRSTCRLYGLEDGE